jgi:predicted transcriptional regulator
MEDIVAFAFMAVATLLGLLGFLAILEMKEIKEHIHRYAPNLPIGKSDQELINAFGKAWIDDTLHSLKFRPSLPGVKDGNTVYVVDQNYQAQPPQGRMIVLHQGVDFSVLKGPEGLMPKVTGDLALPPPPIHGPRRHYWFGKQRYEIAVYGMIAILAFWAFYNTILPILLGNYNLSPINWNNPYNPYYGFPVYLIVSAFAGIVCMIFFFVASHMFGWEILDAIVGHLRGRIMFSKNGKQLDYVKQARIIKLLDEGKMQIEVAKKLKISLQNANNQVRRLRKRGFVERIENGKYRATDRGKRIIEKVFGGD